MKEKECKREERTSLPCGSRFLWKASPVREAKKPVSSSTSLQVSGGGERQEGRSCFPLPREAACLTPPLDGLGRDYKKSALLGSRVRG